ncbi:hypothetical protein ACFWWB_19220 [Streptomyces sp. NPDC058690]|uniref:hypothetical protein n=1 Tax=Streptomyces sp. NPDC058690 TaxID=3346600 RepID=UPI00365C2393
MRNTGHILDVLDVLHANRLSLRIHDGAFSAMDLTARHPRTGEMLSTVKFMVQALAAAGELQRELTYDGLRAAEAKGSKGGPPPRRGARQDHRRPHRVPGRPLHRRARPRPRRQPRRHPHGRHRPHAQHAPADREDAPAPELPVTLDMPGKAADFLRTTELGTAEHAALDQHVPVRRGQDYTLRVGATPPCTASSSPVASRSTAPRASRRSRPSARLAGSTRTRSAPSHRSDHDQSQRRRLLKVAGP